MIEKLPSRPLSPGLKITDEEIYNKIQELIDKVNDIEITLELLNNKAIALEKAVKQCDRPIDWEI